MNRQAATAILDQLRRGAWFGGLSPDLQGLIIERSETRSYARGQVISREGDSSRGLFVLLAGRARLMRHVDQVGAVVAYVAEPGFWFGEIGLLGDQPNAVTVVAVQPSKALVLPARRFNELVHGRPGLYREFSRLALQRYALMLGFVVESAAMPAEARLRRRLATLADLRQLDDQGAGQCVLNVSQLELANMIGVSRQRLNRMLKDLESQRLIALPTRRIEILDLPSLRVPIPRRATAASDGSDPDESGLRVAR